MENVVIRRAVLPRVRLGQIGPVVGAWTLGFAPLVLLAFQGGGYDTIVRSQAGIAVWWLLALGVLVGAIRPSLPGKSALAAALLLTALGAWSWITVASSESSERTMAEVARIATYLGFFLLALFTLDRRRAPALVLGVGSAIGLIATLAVLSRLQPHLFPANETGEFLPIAQSRLNWPLNYWNGLAALCAIGLPLALAFAASHRSVLVRGVAAALVPVLALCIDLTVSRGGLAAAALAVFALIALAPQRLRLLSTFGITGTASAILIAAAAQRDLIHKDLSSTAALTQGDELTIVLGVVALGAAFLQIGIALLEPLRGAPAARFAPRQVVFATSAVASVAVVCAAAGGVPGQLADAWDEFKDPAAQSAIATNNSPSRLGSLSSNGRYELWTVAANSLAANPAAGTGPGTFEFAWLRENKLGGTVRDAHSFYLEQGAEAGWPGLLLGISFVLALFGSVATLRRADRELRWVIAASVGGLTAYAVAAGIDWIWELSVLPATATLLAAAGFAAGRHPAPVEQVAKTRRVVLALCSFVPIAVLVIVLAGASSLKQSRMNAHAGSLGAAFERTVDAHAIEPRAASPLLQSALIRERSGNLTGAIADAREALRREPSNWRHWLVMSRLEARAGNSVTALSMFRRARSLNPNHSILR